MTALATGGGDMGHPRLYFAASDLQRLRKLGDCGLHAEIWKNLRESAEWCLTLEPRQEWIAPISPDPDYENLYDRFYAIMGDLAVTEHLAFAYAFSGDGLYGEAARQWTLASARAWRRETDEGPSADKAYAVCRLLKGLAVGYDITYGLFTESELKEIRDTLISIGDIYYKGYFRTPLMADWKASAHHQIVEWASFGVAALALLGETSMADKWVEAVVKKFEEQLIPKGLAADGAQTEGGTFWASTMQYRLFFMDALRRVTGRDLFSENGKYMSAELALASIACRKHPGYNRSHETVVLEPSYGQLDYYAPVLLYLAREYRRPIYQYLALWDSTLGCIQQTRYVTPHGERLLFELGGYAYLWYDPEVAANPGEEELSYHFPSVNEAYLRASWRPDDLLVGIRRGEIVVHAGGQPVLIEPGIRSEPTTELHVQNVEDNGSTALIRCVSPEGSTLEAELHRPDNLLIRRRVTGDWQWWCHGSPVHELDSLTWGDRVRLRVAAGKISNWEPAGYKPVLSVGFGKLKMADPAPKEFPRATVRPSTDNEIAVEIRILC